MGSHTALAAWCTYLLASNKTATLQLCLIFWMDKLPKNVIKIVVLSVTFSV